MVKEQVLTLLDQYNGNVDVVATELGISKSYVNRLKKSDWRPSAPAQALSPFDAPEPSNALITKDDLYSLVPTNVAGIAQLRDEVITQIKKLMPEIGVKDLVKLLEVLFNYENSIKQMLRPTLMVDRRTQNNITINTLVEKLSGVDQEQLIELAGLPLGVYSGPIKHNHNGGNNS